MRAFSPAVAVFSSSELDDRIREKGFKDGFRALIRPFGERISGKVVVRDSVGASRTWEDFGVHFIDLWDPTMHANIPKPDMSPFHKIEELLAAYVGTAEQAPQPHLGTNGAGPDHVQSSSLYTLFMSRLLCSSIISPHETFLHPVACVMAVNASHSDPVEALRSMYAHSNSGSRSLPLWVNPEYLRYYVLVHDDDRDDFSRSTHFFDLMKRHFGLHCHLLRIRGSQALPTDDDSVEVESAEWLSPQEDMKTLAGQGTSML